MSLKVSNCKPFFINAIEGLDQTWVPSCIPAYLFIKEARDHIASICLPELSSEPLKNDLWGFDQGWFWQQILAQHRTVEELYASIQERHSEIRSLKENYRLLIETNEALSMLGLGLTPNGTYQIDSDRLQLIEEGISGSYFLLDDSATPRFVVKPIDEDGGCLNNRKGLATPFTMSPFRDAMPLYRSSLRESLAYQIASEISVSGIAPKTALAILESPQFFDLSDQVALEEQRRYFDHLSLADREKLCSVQEYIAGVTLFEALQGLQASGLSDEEIANRFDQNDIEDVNILLWTTYDTDGHSGNLLVYPKGVDELGNERLGLKKIDNGLAFPDENRFLNNALAYIPNAGRPLSNEGRAKIAAIDVNALAALAEAHNLSSAVNAMRQRIAILKELAQTPDITLGAINREMTKIGQTL